MKSKKGTSGKKNGGKGMHKYKPEEKRHNQNHVVGEELTAKGENKGKTKQRESRGAGKRTGKREKAKIKRIERQQKSPGRRAP